MQDNLYTYLLMLGDNSMILGHRLSELCGHGPSLETDIALTNMSLDLFGQVRSYFQYAAKVKGDDATEDSIAFLRTERKHLSSLLVEQPNTDFAHVITRQYFFDQYHLLLLEQLCESNDDQINAIAKKSIKEVKYHHRFSKTWMRRLAQGTDVSHQKMQVAVTSLYPYTEELSKANGVEKAMLAEGIGADLDAIKVQYYNELDGLLSDIGLQKPEEGYFYKGGKEGIHTEHFGFILSDFQYMQRTYPDMTW